MLRFVRRIRIDNEFVANKITTYFEVKGIAIESTAPYHHYQNGVAERNFWTERERTAAMLRKTLLPQRIRNIIVDTADELLQASSAPEKLFSARVGDRFLIHVACFHASGHSLVASTSYFHVDLRAPSTRSAKHHYLLQDHRPNTVRTVQPSSSIHQPLEPLPSLYHRHQEPCCQLLGVPAVPRCFCKASRSCGTPQQAGSTTRTHRGHYPQGSPTQRLPYGLRRRVGYRTSNYHP